MADLTATPCTLRNAVKMFAGDAVANCDDATLEWLAGMGDTAERNAADLAEVLEAIACEEYNDELGHPWHSAKRFTALTMHLSVSLDAIATLADLAGRARSEQKSRAYQAGTPRKSSRARSTEDSSKEARNA